MGLAMRKLVASAEQFFIDLLCIVLLALPNVICNGSQGLIVRIEAKTEHISHLPTKLRADLHCRQDWHMFSSTQVLNAGNRINAVVIGDRNHAKAFFCQVVEQVLR